MINKNLLELLKLKTSEVVAYLRYFGKDLKVTIGFLILLLRGEDVIRRQLSEAVVDCFAEYFFDAEDVDIHNLIQLQLSHLL